MTPCLFLPVFAPRRNPLLVPPSYTRQPPGLPGRSSPTCSAKPARVGIAGAGIGGLSAALALLRTPHTGVESVTLFEPRAGVDAGLGAALNMNSGAAVLARKYGLGPALWRIGNPIRSVVASVADGTEAGGAVLYEVDIAATVEAGKRSRETLVDESGEALTMTVMRGELQQMLVDELPDGAEVVRGRSVEGVVRVASGKYRFRFDGGGESEEFDLVIGCDGIKSAVRKYVSPAKSEPVYSGIQIQFAVTPPRPRGDPAVDSTLRQYFGDGGYALQYTAGGRGKPVSDLLAVVYAGDAAVAENVNYEQSDAKAKCGERMRRGGIMQAGPTDVFERAERFVEVGVYYHDALSRWSDGGGAVLVGDAAHAMPPFLGAGAGQAIQDAHALSCAIAEIGDKHKDLATALAAYQSQRQVATNAILQTSRLIGLLETQSGVLSKARNALFRVLGLGGITGKVYVTSATPTVNLD